MKYKLVVSPEAETDIEKAFEWYEERGEGLGKDFVLKARNSIKGKYQPGRFRTRSPWAKQDAYCLSGFFTRSSIQL